MAWGQDFLKGFVGFDGLKDYSHAAKTFLQNGYENAPRQKFLFHVYFTINRAVPALQAAFPNADTATIGLMVKTAQLPSYQMSVETLNQYNRKRLAQTKIEYNPCQIEFHDDGSDLIRNMWYNYFQYYYKDPSQAYDNVTNQNGQMATVIGTPAGFNYNARDIYNSNQVVNDWGYIGESYSSGVPLSGAGNTKPPFFRDIRIYGMNQHKFAEYILINPLIESWTHDTYDYSASNGIMSHRMTVKYETVKYYTGAIGKSRPDTNVVGFADPSYYDNVPSSLARPGSTQTVLGQGGLLDAGIGIVEDLQSGGVGGLIGATQKALTAYNTIQKIPSVAALAKAEVNQAAQNAIRGALPGVIRGASSSPLNSPLGTPTQPVTNSSGGIFFPTPPVSTRSPGFNPSLSGGG
jgi:hypothetical protein